MRYRLDSMIWSDSVWSNLINCKRSHRLLYFICHYRHSGRHGWINSTIDFVQGADGWVESSRRRECVWLKLPDTQKPSSKLWALTDGPILPQPTTKVNTSYTYKTKDQLKKTMGLVSCCLMTQCRNKYILTSVYDGIK